MTVSIHFIIVDDESSAARLLPLLPFAFLLLPSRPPRDFARLRVDADALAFSDEERDANLYAGLKGRGFGVSPAARRVAFDARLGLCDREFDVLREFERDRLAVVLQDLHDQPVCQITPVVA